MTWRIGLEVPLTILSLALGVNLWAIIKSPAHLRHLLADRDELNRLLNFLGTETLAQEASRVEPIAGSWANNISMWERAHAASLSRTRNILLLLAAGLFIASYCFGLTYLAFNLSLLLLTAALPIPSSSKNNNSTHIHTLVLNIMQWHTKQPAECLVYCTRENPSLRTLHGLVVALR